jgi:hypothetical protein
MDIGMETTNLFVTNYPEGVRRVFVINGKLICFICLISFIQVQLTVTNF